MGAANQEGGAERRRQTIQTPSPVTTTQMRKSEATEDVEGMMMEETTTPREARGDDVKSGLRNEEKVEEKQVEHLPRLTLGCRRRCIQCLLPRGRVALRQTSEWVCRHLDSDSQHLEWRSTRRRQCVLQRWRMVHLLHQQPRVQQPLEAAAS